MFNEDSLQNECPPINIDIGNVNFQSRSKLDEPHAQIIGIQPKSLNVTRIGCNEPKVLTQLPFRKSSFQDQQYSVSKHLQNDFQKPSLKSPIKQHEVIAQFLVKKKDRASEMQDVHRQHTPLISSMNKSPYFSSIRKKNSVDKNGQFEIRRVR